MGNISIDRVEKILSELKYDLSKLKSDIRNLQEDVKQLQISNAEKVGMEIGYEKAKLELARNK